MRPVKTEQGTQWRVYYSLTDHLGNVRAEFAAHDNGQPELVQQADYYPFGYTLRREDYGSDRADQPNLQHVALRANRQAQPAERLTKNNSLIHTYEQTLKKMNKRLVI